jgi:hypothetical protein
MIPLAELRDLARRFGARMQEEVAGDGSTYVTLRPGNDHGVEIRLAMTDQEIDILLEDDLRFELDLERDPELRVADALNLCEVIMQHGYEIELVFGNGNKLIGVEGRFPVSGALATSAWGSPLDAA